MHETSVQVGVSAVGPLQTFASGRLRASCAHRGRRCPPGAHTVAVGAAHRLHCAARSGVAPQNSLRSLRSLRSNSRGESDHEARAARAPTPALACAGRAGPKARPLARQKQSTGLFPSGLACSSPPKSPPPGSTCREVHGCCCSLKTRHGGCKGAPGQAAQRLGGAEHRRACGRARSAHPQLTCRRLFERSERSERSEFGDRPRDREAQGSRRAAATAEVKRSSLPGCGFARASARMQSRRRSSAAGRTQTPTFIPTLHASRTAPRVTDH